MTQRQRSLLLAALLGLFALLRVCQPAAGSQPGRETVPAAHGPGQKPACEPGYTLVEETCYKEVVRKVCRVVPEVKKVSKWVYETRDEHYCLPTCPGLLCHRTHEKPCDGCPPGTAHPGCGKPACRRVLVKKEVTIDCPGYKRVVEDVVERVPYTVWRKVPCGASLGWLRAQEQPDVPPRMEPRK